METAEDALVHRMNAYGQHDSKEAVHTALHVVITHAIFAAPTPRVESTNQTG